MEDRRLMFVEFPTPDLLQDANYRYGQLGSPVPKGGDGEILPFPTVTRKQQVFNVQQHQQVDNHAIQTPDFLLSEDLQTLVSHLGQECTTDLAKIRAFFRFIAARNLDTLPSVKPEENTALWYLENIKTIRGDYTDIFIALCKTAGIPCKKVEGLVKGVGYVPGDNLEEKGKKHLGSWAACYVEGEWRLVDVHWGSRHTTGGAKGDWELIDGAGDAKKDATETEAMKYECNEYYFLTDPHEFIYNHFPTEGDQWQLLARPVTKREFEDMVYLEPGFFDMGLKVLGHPRCVLQVPEGDVDMVFGLPDNGSRSFMYKLWKSSKDGMTNMSDLEDIKLERYVFLRQNKKQNTLKCRINFPVAGKFKFELFAKDADLSAMFSKVSSYIIECAKPYEDCNALPENSRREWGPGADLEKVGLEAVTHLDGLVEADVGLVEMRFKAGDEVDILHHLSSSTKDKDQLKNYVVHRHEEGEIVINIKLPEKGLYAFNIFAKKDSTEKNFANVCSYLVSSAEPAFDLTPYPEVVNGKLGPTEHNKKYGLAPLVPKSALMEGPPTGELDVIFTTSKPLDMTHRLQLQTLERKESMDQHVFQIVEPNKVTFKVWIPEPGMYGLTLFAKEKGIEGSLDCIYQGVIDARYNRRSCIPFPKINPPWGEGYELIRPMEGQLPSNNKVPFALKVPGAFYVAVIGANGWTQLENHDGVWQGDVETADAGTDIKLSAEFEEGSGSYTTLLLFSVVPGEDLQKLNDEQEKEAKIAEDKVKEQEALKAKREADFEHAKKELVDATNVTDTDQLRLCIRKVENKRYSSRLKPEMEEAKEKLLSLESMESLCNNILDLDEASVDELQSYDDPPATVHEPLVACFLLLREDEGRTRNWPECKKLCQAPDLRNRVQEFNVESLHPEIASRSYDILTQHRQDLVHETSQTTGVVYAWTLGMIEELRNKDPSAKAAPPADLARQREIFSERGVKEESNSETDDIEVLEDIQKVETVPVETAKEQQMEEEEPVDDLEVCKNELLQATQDSDADRLRQAINKVERKGYGSQLELELVEARMMLTFLENDEIEVLDDEEEKIETISADATKNQPLPEEEDEAFEEIKIELLDATQDGVLDRLKRAIKNVKNMGYTSQLEPELKDARQKLNTLEMEEKETLEAELNKEHIPEEPTEERPLSEGVMENNFEQVKTELLDATQDGVLDRLKRAIKNVKNMGYTSQLEPELKDARQKLNTLEMEEKETLEAELNKEPIPEEPTEEQPLSEGVMENNFEQVKTEILDATVGSDGDRLSMAIEDVETGDYNSQLEPELLAAKQKLSDLRKVDKLPDNILELDVAAIDELQSYDEPPSKIHDILIACLLLLKEHEGKTRNWSECKRLCQASELRRHVEEFEPDTLHPEIASRAHAILGEYKPESVQDINKAAQVIRLWTVCMIEKLQTKDPTSKRAPPANITRQKEIFNVKDGQKPVQKMDCSILFFLFCLTMILFSLIILWSYMRSGDE